MKTENSNEELRQAADELSKTFSGCLVEVYAAVKAMRDELSDALNRDGWNAKERVTAKKYWSKLNRFCHAFEAFHAASVDKEET